VEKAAAKGNFKLGQEGKFEIHPLKLLFLKISIILNFQKRSTLSIQITIGLFINPTAGKGKALKTAAIIKQRLQTQQLTFTSYEIWPAEFPAVTEAWIIGGDGSLNYFINLYPAVAVPLAIFKGGTGNDFAWKLYGDSNTEQQLDSVLAAAAKPVDVGICNGKLYFNSTGIGFDGEVLRSMKTVRLFGGHLGYLMVVIKKIFTFKESRFAIEADGQHFNDRYLIVAVNNSSRTGGGFMVSPKASVADGLLDMVLCKKLSVWQRLKVLPIIEKGKHIELPFIHYGHHHAVTVRCEKQMYAQLDGELISGQIFEMSVQPARFLFKY
jgi:diacylglycerol kinase (ATP)